MEPRTAPTARHWLANALDRLLDEPGALDSLSPDLSVQEAWLEAAAILNWSPDQVAEALARRFRLEVADLDSRDRQAAQLLPETSARKHAVVVIAHTDRTLTVASSNPLDADTEQEIGFLSGRNVVFQVAPPEALEQILAPSAEREMRDVLDDISNEFLDVVRVVVSEDQEELSERELSTTPVIRLTNLILQRAVQSGATDIHMEPERDGGRVRFRVDGVLHPFMTLPLPAHIRVVSRIKILADMDIADRIRPQDGRLRIEIGGRPLDLRISSIPVRGSEKVVVRILDPAATFSIKRLGLSVPDRDGLKRLLGHRTGVVLVTGPTGSGKTTTLYGALTELSSAELNISTVEHPVEYELRGVSQIQVEPKKGVTFASALRALLRQDPDVILVGEIRDSETATIAANASMTGHQVLSTLHTNDALGAITRLEELGLDRATISATLRGVVAQRLLRRFCPHCVKEVRSERDLSVEERALVQETGVTPTHTSTGCEECADTGFKGRLPVLEIVEVDREIANAIARDCPEGEIRTLLESKGFKALQFSALERVRAGLTSLAEVHRVLGDWDQAAEATAAPATPAQNGASAPAGASNGSAPAASSRQLVEATEDGPTRVLVVEDDTGTRTLIRASLAKAGYEVIEARDGEEALNVLGSPSENVHLVTLDLNMPKVDGTEVLRVMRSEPGMLHIPVVVATHSDDEASEMELLSAGADDYLVKPVNPARLLGRLEAVLRRHRLRMTGV